MTVHIWCPRASESAIKLRDGLRAAGIKCYKTKAAYGTSTSFVDRIKANDLIVNWGPARVTLFNNVVLLNSAATKNKQEQLIHLALHGIPCPEVFDTPAENRLGRSFKHQCASDLLRGNGRDYYTQKLPFVRECRVHVFQGKSIHAGIKTPRPGSIAHPWIRSSASGWKIDYTQASRIKQDRRDLAKRAVEALGLDFGAVDIGIVADGRAAVIEVNTAPGLEGSTVDAYVKQIVRIHNERNAQ